MDLIYTTIDLVTSPLVAPHEANTNHTKGILVSIAVKRRKKDKRELKTSPLWTILKGSQSLATFGMPRGQGMQKWVSQREKDLVGFMAQ